MGAAAGLGAIGSIMGGVSGSNSQNQQNQLAQKQLDQQNAIMQQELGIQQGVANDFAKYQGTEQKGVNNAYNSIINGPGQNVGNALSSYMGAGASPTGLDRATGVNGLGLTMGAANYLSNPGGTNVAGLSPGIQQQLGAPSQLQGGSGDLASFFHSQMAGNNPQLQQAQGNAQNRLQQQYDQSLSTLGSHAAPGQNQNAMKLDLQNQLLGASANLGAQQSGETFAAEQGGAQGLQGLLSSLDSTQLQRLLSQFGIAQSTDQQKSGMLTEGADLANRFNQQAFGNMGNAYSSGQTAVNDAQTYVQQGRQNVAQAGVGLGNLANSVGQQSVNSQANAASYGNPWQSAVSGAVSAFGNPAPHQGGINASPAPYNNSLANTQPQFGQISNFAPPAYPG